MGSVAETANSASQETQDVSLAAFRRYLESVKAPATVRKYGQCVEHFIELVRVNNYSGFEQLPVDFLTEFILLMQHDGKGPAIIHLHICAVRKYLEWAKTRGVDIRVHTRPELPKVHLRQRPCLSPDMFRDYFRQADMDLIDPVRTAVMLLPCCGLRVSELVGLRLGSLHRAKVLLKNGKKKETLFLRVIGKGGRERNVPLMEEGEEILYGYLRGWRKDKPGTWLFPSITKKPETSGVKAVQDSYIRTALREMRKHVGGGMVFTPHTMRRTYITMLWRKGVKLEVISKIAGHVNVQTTLNHYIVMDPTDSLQAVHDAGGSLLETTT